MANHALVPKQKTERPFSLCLTWRENEAHQSVTYMAMATAFGCLSPHLETFLYT